MLERLAREGTLGAQARRGAAWQAVSRAAITLLGFGGQVVLMTLLLPTDFGLVALGLVVTGFASLVSGLGLTTAVVQAPHITDRFLTSVFWLGASVGLLSAAAVASLAPLAALAFDEPRVTALLQVSALAFVLNLGLVPTAMLQRSLRFGLIGTIDVIASLSGLLTSIVLAFLGAGAFALVIGPLVLIAVTTVSSFLVVRWLPTGKPGRAELAQVWSFSRGLTGAQILYFASRNFDTVILGMTAPAAAVGLYSRAYNLMMLPLSQITQVLTRVTLPVFALMQTDLPRLRRAWLTTVRMSLLFGLPVGLGFAVTAHALIEVLYPPRWLPMVPVLVLLASSLPPQLVARNYGSLYEAMGRTGLQFRVAAVGTAVTVVAVLIGSPWGIVGVAWAMLFSACARAAIGLRAVMALVEMPLRELVGAVGGLMLAGLMLVIAAIAAGALGASLPPILLLATQTVAGGIGFFAGLAMFERSMVVKSARRVLRRG